MRAFTLLAVLAAAPAAAQSPADPVLERMKKDVFFLAGPECEGRGVETEGLNKAAAHIADTFKANGVKPAFADGSYFQPFTVLTGNKLGTPNTLAFAGPKDARTELTDKDFGVLGFSTTSKASGGLVFAGYGITSKELKYDDYAGLDAAGKVVVILRKTPRPGKTGDGRFDTTTGPNADSPHAPFAAKIANAAAHKVAGVVIVNDPASAGTTDALFDFALHAAGTEPAAFPVLHLKRAAFDKLLSDAGEKTLADIEKGIDETLKPASFELSGWKADAAVTVHRSEFKVKNVVGVIDGSGPLANETVVIGAHYDHLGDGRYGSMGGPKANGKTHFGADDNASGTTGVLELARRYGAMKDRAGRRIVLIAFSGEERGLLGSVHYCKNPAFPHEATAAMINLDMIGRSKPIPADWLELTKKDRLLVYGTGSGDTLDALVTDKNRRHDFKLSKLAAGTGPSDHDSFYRKKVPVLFFYTGTHDQYHQPTDTPDLINVPAMRKVVDLVQDLTDTLTTVPTPPKYLVTRDQWTDPTSPHATTAKLTGPKLGLRPDYSFEGEGMRLEGVSPNGAAEKAGLKEGDLVIELGGKPVKTVVGYMNVLNGMKAGVEAEVVVLRGAKKVTLKVTPQ